MHASLRKYVALQRASVQMSLAYRGNVLVMIVLGAFWQGAGLALVLIVLQHFHTLAGWTFRDIAFLYGLRLMAHALWLVPLGSLTAFDSTVRYGEFDLILLRPVNIFVQSTSRPRWFLGAGDAVLALAVFGISLGYASVRWTVADGFLCVAFIVAGALIEAAVQVVVAGLAFRFTTSQQLSQLTDGAFTTIGSYPLNLFGPGMQKVFTFGIPVAFVAYLGAALLLHKSAGMAVPAWLAYLGPAVGAGLFSLAYWFWTCQARHYQSTGS